jgi:hypothetical protein
MFGLRSQCMMLRRDDIEWSTAMSNKSNSTVATMGVDIGKNSFHVVGLMDKADQGTGGAVVNVIALPG